MNPHATTPAALCRLDTAALAAKEGPPPATRALVACAAWLVAAVALAGLAGYVRVHRLLRRETADHGLVRRVLLAWIAISGFVGSEVCWICTPMLARPDLPVPFLNPNAFRMNMYEYLWHQWQRRVSILLTDTASSNIVPG